MTNLFAATNQTTVTSGANQLQKTAQLTAHATRIMNHIMQVVEAEPELWAGQVLASQKDHDAMDDLIDQTHPLTGREADEENGIVGLLPEDVDYLKTLSEEELEKMIRSQQSKRSRAKSKDMTRENYQTMLVGAVAENLLRIAGDKPKSSGGGSATSETGFTDDQLNEFATDAEKLKKAIRNVQSKKSIYLSKKDTSKDDPYYKGLLADEAMLKAIRDNGTQVANEEAQQAIEAKKQAEELLAAAGDIEDPNEALELLNKMKEILASK